MNKYINVHWMQKETLQTMMFLGELYTKEALAYKKITSSVELQVAIANENVWSVGS